MFRISVSVEPLAPATTMDNQLRTEAGEKTTDSSDPSIKGSSLNENSTTACKLISKCGTIAAGRNNFEKNG